MSRFSILPVSFSLALALASSLPRAAVASEVVELPALAVNEKPVPGAGAATVVGTDGGPAADGGFADLARQVAGFSANDAGARGFGTTTTLRGLGNTPYFSNASAPVYLDDIPLASAFTFPSGMFDFSAMTVARGPQAAARFGRAGDAGVIQFVAAEPGANARTQFGASAGNHGQLAFALAAQTARLDKFDATINLGTAERDGYIYNTNLQRTVDDRSAVYGRAKLRYRPAADLELTLQVIGQRSHDGAQPLVPLGGPFFEVNRGKEGEADTSFAAAAVGLTRKLPNATVSSTTSYTDWKLDPYANRLVVFGKFNLDSGLTQAQRTFNEELRFNSEQLTGGAFFSHDRTTGGASRSFSGFPYEDSSFVLDSDTVALFGRAIFRPTADWVITPGLRLEQDSRKFSRTETVPGSSLIRLSDRWNALLPSLAATRQFNRTTDLTLTLARGFKPGGYSAYTGRADLAGFDPQRTWGLEAALTTVAPDAKWTATARAYAYRVSGYQIERSFAVPATSTDEYLVVNANRAQVLGLEVETAWRPQTDVTVRAMGGLTAATLKDFTDPFTHTSYSGNQAPFAPAGNAALRVDYRPARGWSGGAGVTWTGRTYYDEQQTAALSQDAYTLADAYAGYAFGWGEVRLFGRNLGDKAYYSSITAGVGHGTPGAPRLWGVEVDCRW